MPLINSSVLYSYIGNNAKAEENLKKVLKYDPDNETANLNLGLLLAELGRFDEAEKALRIAVDSNPEGQPVAAKNLSVLVAQRGDLAGAVHYAKLAWKARPEDPNYGYTLAYYQMQNGQKSQATKTLKSILMTNPEFLTATSFLADIYMRDGNKDEALRLYKNAQNVQGISAQDRTAIQQSIAALERM